MSHPVNEHLELPIPNGWFAVAFSREIGPGEVKRIRYFDEDLVLFRTLEGEAHVLNAYCPHLGAHLGEGGVVVGETLRCPFHFWHVDGAGRCTKIPYAKRIPERARVRSWPVVERNRLIFVWHHAEEKAPYWEVPEIPQLANPDWTEPRHFTLEVDVHMQEMAENNADPAHFLYVHGAEEVPDQEVTYADDGRYFKATSWSEKVTPFGTFQIELERETWGMGMSSVEMKGLPNAGLYMFSSTAPIGRRKTISRWLFTVSKNVAEIAGPEFIEQMQAGVEQDRRIWQNKIYRGDPVLCDGDPFIGDFRRWCRQFYSDPSVVSGGSSRSPVRAVS